MNSDDTVKRRPLVALIAAVVLSSSFHQPVAAKEISLIHTEVVTHRSQGDVQEVQGATATLLRSKTGVFVDVATRDLNPGHAHTMWLVAINAPHECADSPCASTDVLGASDIVASDLGFIDGVIVNADGSARFAGFQPVGELEKSWFGKGLVDADAEIHLVVRDHGPLQLGLERQMLTSFRGGCADDSVPTTLPETARSDGFAGDYACSNQQVAIFLP